MVSVHKRIISTVKRLEFVSNRMSYIILRGRWTSPDEKTHNQIDHILLARRRHSNILYV
jgi:hypothetical protein